MDERSHVLWSGILCVKGVYACPVQITSNTSISLPEELGRCLNLKWQVKSVSSLNTYLKLVPTAGVLRNREVFVKGWYFNSCSIKPLDSRERFSRITQHFQKTDSISVVKMGKDILLVTPDTQVTEDLGLMKDDQCLHCIVLSKQSKYSTESLNGVRTNTEAAFMISPPTSSLLTNESLHCVFHVDSHSHATKQGHSHHAKVKKSSSDDKRVAQSVKEHPERKRHKSEHSPSVTASPKTPKTPVSKRDKVSSKRSRHKSETHRKKEREMSPSVKIVTTDTICVMNEDKFCSDSSKVNKDVGGSNKSVERQRTTSTSSSVCDDRENVLKKSSSKTKLKSSDVSKKRHSDEVLVQSHGKKKTKDVAGDKKSEKSREKEHDSKKLSVQKKKQLESEKVLSQLIHGHGKEDFSSLGRIPKKNQKEKNQDFKEKSQDSKEKSQDSKKKQTESKSESKKESSSKEKRLSSEIKKPKRSIEPEMELGHDEKDNTSDHEVTEPKQILNENRSEMELTYERDNIWDDLFNIKYSSPSAPEMALPFLSPKHCFKADKDSLQPYTNQKNKTSAGSIPGLGDLDKLRMLECKQRHTKVKRFIRKIDDGLLVKVKDDDKGLELWSNVDSFTAFVTQSLHRVPKCDVSLEDCDSYQLFAEKIHDINSLPKSNRLTIVGKWNPYDIKIYIENPAYVKKTKETVETLLLDNNENVEVVEDSVSNKLDDIVKRKQKGIFVDTDKVSIGCELSGKQSFVDVKGLLIEKEKYKAVDANKNVDGSKISKENIPTQPQESIYVEADSKGQKQDLEQTRTNQEIDRTSKSVNRKDQMKLDKEPLTERSTVKADAKVENNENIKMSKAAEPGEKAKELRTKSDEKTYLKDVRNIQSIDIKKSIGRERHGSGGLKFREGVQVRFTDVDVNKVSSGCELSEKKVISLRDGSLQQSGSLHERLGKIADMSVPTDLKTKKSDKRQERQYHPYKKDSKPKKSNVPTWSFDIAYSDMEELLQNLTENMFKVEYRKPADVRRWRKGTTRSSLGSVRGRFYGHRFRRSEVPDSLPNCTETREEEYAINPELISNMEERARQADIVEESWQHVPKEESSFIEEMCIYGQEKEETQNKSTKNTDQTVQVPVKPDVSLVIPGMGKTSMYSGVDLSDNDNSDEEFLHGNNSEREKVDAPLSPSRSITLRRDDKYKNKDDGRIESTKRKKTSPEIGADSSSQQSCSKILDEVVSQGENVTKTNPSHWKVFGKEFKNGNESSETSSKLDQKVDGGKDESDREAQNDQDLTKTKNNEGEKPCPKDSQDKDTSSKQDECRERRILSSDSDVCLDWSDEDVNKDDQQSDDDNDDDDHDDDTFVVIDTVEGCDSDTPGDEENVHQGCCSPTISEDKNDKHTHDKESLTPTSNSLAMIRNMYSESSTNNKLPCESDGNETMDEYKSDHYNTVDETTDCDNPGKHSRLEDAISDYVKTLNTSVSSLNDSHDSEENKTIREDNMDNYKTIDEVSDCDNACGENSDTTQIKEPKCLQKDPLHDDVPSQEGSDKKSMHETVGGTDEIDENPILAPESDTKSGFTITTDGNAASIMDSDEMQVSAETKHDQSPTDSKALKVSEEGIIEVKLEPNTMSKTEDEQKYENISNYVTTNNDDHHSKIKQEPHILTENDPVKELISRDDASIDNDDKGHSRIDSILDLITDPEENQFEDKKPLFLIDNILQEQPKQPVVQEMDHDVTSKDGSSTNSETKLLEQDQISIQEDFKYHHKEMSINEVLKTDNSLNTQVVSTFLIAKDCQANSIPLIINETSKENKVEEPQNMPDVVRISHEYESELISEPAVCHTPPSTYSIDPFSNDSPLVFDTRKAVPYKTVSNLEAPADTKHMEHTGVNMACNDSILATCEAPTLLCYSHSRSGNISEILTVCNDINHQTVKEGFINTDSVAPTSHTFTFLKAERDEWTVLPSVQTAVIETNLEKERDFISDQVDYDKPTDYTTEVHHSGDNLDICHMSSEFKGEVDKTQSAQDQGDVTNKVDTFEDYLDKEYKKFRFEVAQLDEENDNKNPENNSLGKMIHDQQNEDKPMSNASTIEEDSQIDKAVTKIDEVSESSDSLAQEVTPKDKIVEQSSKCEDIDVEYEKFKFEIARLDEENENRISDNNSADKMLQDQQVHEDRVVLTASAMEDTQIDKDLTKLDAVGVSTDSLAKEVTPKDKIDEESNISHCNLTYKQTISTEADIRFSKQNTFQDIVCSQSLSGITSTIDGYNSNSPRSNSDSEKQFTIKIKPISNPDRFESPKSTSDSPTPTLSETQTISPTTLPQRDRTKINRDNDLQKLNISPSFSQPKKKSAKSTFKSKSISTTAIPSPKATLIVRPLMNISPEATMSENTILSIASLNSSTPFTPISKCSAQISRNISTTPSTNMITGSWSHSSLVGTMCPVTLTAMTATSSTAVSVASHLSGMFTASSLSTMSATSSTAMVTLGNLSPSTTMTTTGSPTSMSTPSHLSTRTTVSSITTLSTSSPPPPSTITTVADSSWINVSSIVTSSTSRPSPPPVTTTGTSSENTLSSISTLSSPLPVRTPGASSVSTGSSITTLSTPLPPPPHQPVTTTGTSSENAVSSISTLSTSPPVRTPGDLSVNTESSISTLSTSRTPIRTQGDLSVSTGLPVLDLSSPPPPPPVRTPGTSSVNSVPSILDLSISPPPIGTMSAVSVWTGPSISTLSTPPPPPPPPTVTTQESYSVNTVSSILTSSTSPLTVTFPEASSMSTLSSILTLSTPPPPPPPGTTVGASSGSTDSSTILSTPPSVSSPGASLLSTAPLIAAPPVPTTVASPGDLSVSKVPSSLSFITPPPPPPATTSGASAVTTISVNQQPYNVLSYGSAEWPMLGPYSHLYTGYGGQYGPYSTTQTTDGITNSPGLYPHPSPNIQPNSNYSYPVYDYQQWYPGYTLPLQQPWYGPFYPTLPLSPVRLRLSPVRLRSSPVRSPNRRGAPRSSSNYYGNSY